MVMFAGRIGRIYRSAVLLSTLYNILGICQNKKIPQVLEHLRDKLPTNRRLMNNANCKLYYTIGLSLLIGLFFMPIIR